MLDRSDAEMGQMLLRNAFPHSRARCGRSRAGQNGVKMGSRWGQNGSRCQEGDAKVDRENSIVEFSTENCTNQNPRSRRHASDKTDAGGFYRQSRWDRPHLFSTGRELEKKLLFSYIKKVTGKMVSRHAKKV